MIRPRSRRRPLSLLVSSAAALAVLGLFAGILGGCSRDSGPGAKATALVPAKSADCRPCHEEIYKSWAGSHHAKAHRPVDARTDGEDLAIPRDFLEEARELAA